MITPSFSLTATERVLPKLALDFTTASLDPRVTFTRSGNTATYTNSYGVITAINADLPRFDYNPTTLICQGLLIEEARTNVLLNSLIDGTSLATQNVTTTAAAVTLSFYGTGSIDLSGTHTATVAGTGAYPSRKTYTFTPTAGTLTLTVTGTVQFAQLETGSFATSFIPTDGAIKTRNADVATMTGTNFSDWYNASQGAVVTQSVPNMLADAGTATFNLFNSGTNYIGIYPGSANTGRARIVVSNVAETSIQQSPMPTASQWKQAVGYAVNNAGYAVNGSLVGTDTTTNLPTSTPTELRIGRDQVNRYVNTQVSKLMYWSQRLTNAELAAFSKV